jgi:hypothetical protein
VDGVEVDYTSNEVLGVLRGVLQGNGNFLERVLDPAPFAASDRLASLRPLVVRSLSRRVHRHYRGFGSSQLQEAQRKPTAKRVLYVLRTTLTGAHLLATGRLETDLTAIAAEYGFGAASELVERKLAGEATPLSGADLVRWRSELERAFATLDDAERRSPLPLEPPNEAELHAWLVELRRS